MRSVIRAVTPLLDGTFRLDGGAMFGSVPKPLWERRTTADARNRIPLTARPLLVRTPDQTVLIDAGIGGKMSAEGRRHLRASIASPAWTSRWRRPA